MSKQASSKMWLAFLIGVTGCGFSGQAFITARLSLDGKEILQTGYGVPDTMGNKDTFVRLEGKSFEPQNQWAPEDKAAKELTLKGKLELKVQHTSRVRAAVDFEEVKLVSGDRTGTWKLAPGEVDRLYLLLK